MQWKELNFWKTGEYQVIRERYDDLRKSGILINPVRKDIFKALKETPYDSVRVAIFGQDPYPNPSHATGIAFSVPPQLQCGDFPPTLRNVLKEYQDDLHYPAPATGDLSVWAQRGVLLWNVIPSCNSYLSLSHDWPEWEELNAELLKVLGDKEDVIFVFLGGVARRYSSHVPVDRCICLSHPSPRANLSSKTPFLGSRMFSTINSYLKEPIDWRLP